MQKSEYVQIEDVIQETHCFIYKTKKYPFNIDLFKCSSKYFHDNEIMFLPDGNCNIIDEEFERDLNLSDETINYFISFNHRQKIPINDENVVELNYLANKYQVISLIEATKKYIFNHQNALVIQILSTYQNQPSFKTDDFEDIISNNLSNYIKDHRLVKLKISILYRILKENSTKQGEKEAKSNDIIDFLFSCLDNYGKEASVLFEFADFGNSRSECINRLVKYYSGKFDFHYINSSFMMSLYENQNDMIEKEIKSQQKLNEFLLNAENKVDAQLQQYKEQKQIIETEIKKMKEENTNLRLEQKKQLESFENEMKKAKEETEKFNLVQKKNLEEFGKQLTEIKKVKEEINNLKLLQEKQIEKQKQDFEEELTKMRAEMNKIKKESNDLRLVLKKQLKSFEEEITKMKNEIIEIQEENSKFKLQIEKQTEKKDYEEKLANEINQLKMYLKKQGFEEKLTNKINQLKMYLKKQKYKFEEEIEETKVEVLNIINEKNFDITQKYKKLVNSHNVVKKEIKRIKNGLNKMESNEYEYSDSNSPSSE